MKSFHHAHGEESLHFLVEQDAAIDDYLAGLLKDIGEATLTAAPSAVEPFIRQNNPVGLSIVSRAPLGDFEPSDDVIESDNQAAWSPDLHESSVVALSLDMPEDAEAELTDLPQLNTEPQLFAEPAPLVNRVEEPVMADSEPVTTMPVMNPDTTESETVQATVPAVDEAASPVIAAVVKPWRIFAIGGVKVGLPVGEINEVLASPSIEPLKGAPAHVAGTVLHQGRRRMVLSLANWFPGAVVTTSYVLLLGTDGLWGVEVGPELTELPWDDSMTQWRSDDERAGARPWLAGVNRAAGVAFLTVPALRAALKSSR